MLSLHGHTGFKLDNITVNKLEGSSVLQGRPPKRWHFYLVSFFNFHFMFAQSTQLNNGPEKLQQISITPFFLESKLSLEFPPLNNKHNQVLFVALQCFFQCFRVRSFSSLVRRKGMIVLISYSIARRFQLFGQTKGMIILTYALCSALIRRKRWFL